MKLDSRVPRAGYWHTYVGSNQQKSDSHLTTESLAIHVKYVNDGQIATKGALSFVLLSVSDAEASD